MPVVVYYGDESYLLEQAAVKLRHEVVDPAMAGLCHRVYTQPSLATVLEAVGSVSLALGGKTLVEIRDFPMLYQASKDAATDAQLEELRELLEGVDDSKVVLFLSTKLDGKIKFPKWLSKHPRFTVHKYEAYKFWETDKVVDFVLGYAENKGISLSEDGAELLVNSLGTDLRALTMEVDKLEMYAHGRAITRNDVLLMCNHSDNVFQVIHRWILQQDAAQNFRDLDEILMKRNTVEILMTMQSTFNNIFRVLWLNSQGLTLDTIAQRTGQKPFTVKKNLTAYRHVPQERLLKLKHALVETEWKAKTGQLEGQLALEILLGT